MCEEIGQILQELRKEITAEVDPSAIDPLWLLDEIEQRLMEKRLAN